MTHELFKENLFSNKKGFNEFPFLDFSFVKL